MSDNSEYKQHVTDLIKSSKIGMLTTMAPDGTHQSRPMALQEVEFDGDLWFFTFDSSTKVDHINHNPQVNVSLTDSGRNTWVSLAGSAEVIQDKAMAEKLWSPLLKAWFTDGLDTEGLTLIKVHVATAEYWDSPNSTAINLFGMAKAAITGKQPDAGDNKTVNLQ